jgi:hypothetical protein
MNTPRLFFIYVHATLLRGGGVYLAGPRVTYNFVSDAHRLVGTSATENNMGPEGRLDRENKSLCTECTANVRDPTAPALISHRTSHGIYHGYAMWDIPFGTHRMAYAMRYPMGYPIGYLMGYPIGYHIGHFMVYAMVYPWAIPWDHG